jgi:hypothetical protein
LLHSKDHTPIKLRKISSLVTASREYLALNAFGDPNFELKFHIIHKTTAITNNEGLNVVTPSFEKHLTEILNPSQVLLFNPQ